MSEIISRKEAKEIGLTRYFTGKPCKHGHVAERWVSKHVCSTCLSLAKKVYRKNNAEEVAAYQKKYMKDNRETLRIKEAEYRRKNPHYNRNKCAKRKYAKKNSIPSWYSKQDETYYRYLKEQCRYLEKITGIQFHVDHIIPIQGKLVCGLHVTENWQILEAYKNIIKRNKFNPEDN